MIRTVQTYRFLVAVFLAAVFFFAVFFAIGRIPPFTG
jgi:hypothetical protein